jgi:polyphosphate kinase 2 (PPK2 family)
MIDLAKFEKGRKYKGDYDADLAALQDRLARIQVAYIVHRRRAMIVLDGWDAAGKGGIIQRLTSEWDPRHFEVWPIAAPSTAEKERHFLWRFWTRLPGAGQIGVFDRSWYGRVLVERVEGYATPEQWHRAYDEINAFEAQQHQDGVTLIKLFPHVSAKEQDKRLAARIEHPWKRWKTGPEDFRNRARRDDYLAAMHDMFRRTDTAIAPWKVIDGNNKKAARIAALTHIAERLEAAVDMTPPVIDDAVAALAREAFAKKVKAD